MNPSYVGYMKKRASSFRRHESFLSSMFDMSAIQDAWNAKFESVGHIGVPSQYRDMGFVPSPSSHTAATVDTTQIDRLQMRNKCVGY